MFLCSLKSLKFCKTIFYFSRNSKWAKFSHVLDFVRHITQNLYTSPGVYVLHFINSLLYITSLHPMLTMLANIPHHYFHYLGNFNVFTYFESIVSYIKSKLIHDFSSYHTFVSFPCEPFFLPHTIYFNVNTFNYHLPTNDLQTGKPQFT